MDNYVKDNNNKYLLAFLSLLTTREVFDEAKLGLLVVGHTHEDTDGCFKYLSKKLREQNDYIMADLIKAFMVSWERPFIQ
jgi:CO dehydrogenase nickel-insertion accessory protein CooC1